MGQQDRSIGGLRKFIILSASAIEYLCHVSILAREREALSGTSWGRITHPVGDLLRHHSQAADRNREVRNTITVTSFESRLS